MNGDEFRVSVDEFSLGPINLRLTIKDLTAAHG